MILLCKYHFYIDSHVVILSYIDVIWHYALLNNFDKNVELSSIVTGSQQVKESLYIGLINLKPL